MKKILFVILVQIVPLSLTTGCVSSIAKQNVLSSINTGIGLTVAQNPQTQLYEAKIGYIRSQFYSVPTGKTLAEDNGCQETKNDADKAVQLLAGIRVHSGIDNLIIGADITESFAIGSDAVNSPAAIAMYISQAKSDERAKNASEATSQFHDAVAGKIGLEQNQADEITKWVTDKNNPGSLDPANVDLALKGTSLAKQATDIKKLTPEQFRKKLGRSWSVYIPQLSKNLPEQH